MKHKKKNRVITYFLSFIPGAGFLYRNYMKRGISYLALFLGTISIVNWLESGVLWFLPVLIWFYSFFDQINSLGQPEEQLELISDEAVFHGAGKWFDDRFCERETKLLGGGCFVIGAFLFVRYLAAIITLVFPESWQPIILRMMSFIPQILLSCTIMCIGLHLLQKKDGIDEIVQKLFKKREENVVYYMQERKKEERIESNDALKDASEILKEADREHLLEKAKQLLQDEIYQSIHIEEAKQLEKVSVDEAPQLESAAAIEDAAEIERVEITKPENDF